ncbi:hypothetical protein M413DRAFT_32966 [Hebeloma cylindrosporum]|uniref:Uncharacterized protein n=1 Tax=Hebeloma cylindrosporum TaxID=76867 RepID=A0A0C2Y186_HEBCY|nr:hypothetical protein M413DRAFT_32966 [Hebeloma cylindrosporum h7]
MVNWRTFVHQTPKSVELRLSSRLYPADNYGGNTRARMVRVQTRQVYVRRRKARHPFVEGIRGDRRLQPYIHNIFAVVADGRKLYRFMVFLKKHRRAKRNSCLQALVGAGNRRIRIRSDVVVMRRGVRTDYVAMDGAHARAADWLMSE